MTSPLPNVPSPMPREAIEDAEDRAALAERCGLSASYVAEIETGTKAGSVAARKRLAEALDIEPGDLIRADTKG